MNVGKLEEARREALGAALVYLARAAAAARESWLAGEWPSAEKSLQSVQSVGGAEPEQN